MRIMLVLFVCLLLISCVPEPELPAPEPVVKKEPVIIKQEPELKKLVPTAFVTQTFEDGSVIKYSYTSDRILASIDYDNKTTDFCYYEDGKLAKVNDVELVYDGNQLKEVKSGQDTAVFKFNDESQLTQVRNGETLFFLYSDGLLSEFKRGSVGAVTYFTYDNDNIDEIKKANNVYALHYDDDNNLNDINYNKDSAHLIIALGKGDRITKLSGKLYGPGETMDYIVGKINILGTDSSSIESNDEELRIDALHRFLICTRFKKLPVEFDTVAYAVLRNHFNFSLQDYFISNYYCEAFK